MPKKNTKVRKSKKIVDVKQDKDIILLKRHYKELKQIADASLGTLKYRFHDFYKMESLIGETNYAFQTVNNVGGIEAALQILKYYDIQDPSTLDTVSALVGVYSKKFFFKMNKLSITLRCNYNQPAYVIVYKCLCVGDTAQTPIDFLTAQAGDVSNVTANSIGIFPEDIPALKTVWKLRRIFDGIIGAGEQKSFLYNAGSYTYDPSITDTHNLSYQVGNKSGGFLVRTYGVISHDSAVADELAFDIAKLDVMAYLEHTVEYDAGANITHINYLENSSLPTNGLVACNKPIAGTQPVA